MSPVRRVALAPHVRTLLDDAVARTGNLRSLPVESVSRPREDAGMVSRNSCILIALAACGGDPVRHTPDATTHADASADASPDAAPDACVTCQVSGSLSGLLWQLPCADAGSPACGTMPTTTVSATVAGTTGVTYDVTAHFRGVIEQKTYSNGCQDQSWLSGGDDNGDSYNVYELSISSPPQHYFLNAGASSITHCWVIDYEKTFRADAGATVTLFAASKDNQEIRNIDANGQPLTVAGTTVQQPYDGQFIEMDVVSVVPDPVASGATLGTAGPTSALSFTGTQYALADGSAASLMPQDFTLETWFNFAGTPGSFNLLAGKPYQGGTADSYAIWFESGALHAGAGLSSTGGSATITWTPTVGEWHHAAVTYDHTSQLSTFYIDGQAAACATNAAPAYDSQPVMVGADSNNGSIGGFFDGTLDEVRIFSAARTSDQIWSDMHTHTLPATSALAAQWTFDEGTGQTAADSAGANTLTLGANGSADAADPAWISSDVPH